MSYRAYVHRLGRVRCQLNPFYLVFKAAIWSSFVLGYIHIA